MSLPKIVILLPIWKRKDITLLCFSNLKKLKEAYNIEVLCVVSEVWAKMEAFNHGFKWVEAPNDDLGKKMNIGVDKALTMDFDYLMNLGSDDIINERLFDIYKPYMEKKHPMFGITKVTFIDSEEKEAKTCDYQIMIGAGRCIRRDVLEQYGVKRGKSIMYDEGIDKGLDMNSMKKFKCSMTEIDTDFNMIWDIKGADNIWTYKNIGGDFINFDTAVKDLDSETIDKILEL